MVKFKGLISILFGTLLLSTSFAPFSLWFAAPIAYAIYLKVLISHRHQIAHSFLFAFISNAIILSWSKTFVGITPWILLAILQGLYLIPVGFLARYMKSPLALLSAILIMDEVKNYFPFGGFGWSRIAFSQVNSPFLSLTSIIGVIGLSALTLASSLLFIRPSRTHILVFLIPLAITLFPMGEIASNGTLNVRAVQGGVPERGLAFNARAQAVLDNHIERTLKEFQSSDELMIWPENAIDVDPIRNEVVVDKIKNLQKITGVPLLAGAILGGKVIHNTAIKFDRQGSPESTYIKRYLTPFGEYIPLRNIASIVSKHTDRVTDFMPGSKFQVHVIDGEKVSSVICFEILNDQIFRESARHAGVIAVLTNSATFAGSAEGEQQLNITRIRAVETGKNIVSVSTTGPTAFINNRGDVLLRLDDGEVGSLSSPMEVRNGQTFAVKYGAVSSSLVILLAFSTIVLSLAKRRRST